MEKSKEVLRLREKAVVARVLDPAKKESAS
jgi:hypothetical protein